MSIIAFDTDGCLIDKDRKERPEIVALLKALSGNNNYIVVWSGNGVGNVKEVVKRLNLDGYVNAIMDKTTDIKPDLTIDDKDIILGKLNLRIV